MGFFFLCTTWMCCLRCALRPKLLWQIMHWCCLSFSWTHSMWFLEPMWLNAKYSHKPHLYGFLFSWTLKTYLFRVFRCFHFQCRLSVCLLRSLFCPNILLHKSHLNGFLFSCTVWTCFFRFPARPKLLRQMLHRCCLSFSWTHSMCLLRSMCWKAE